ncbi:uncharacterized protein F4812DRAFT_415203 [Daldinia caldariorum]|uniref:uncharacterized protein n=1 Tax=Daldinia caldariorum TaxID=326644 RepID=UPI002008C27D|nr:uncharacterized protein F4812DRAFT_415203 [Daldinia caldariorum]KAI1471713.1 hypothetical protein F4812DRAFT_415203 [Daldinia caldariorum]
MAMTETSPLPTDRQERSGRRRPFTTWVKKLANFKNAASSAEGGRHTHFKRDAIPKGAKKRTSKNNNPYPQSGRISITVPTHQSDPSFSTSRSARVSNPSLLQGSQSSTRISTEEAGPPTAGAPSVAHTTSTDYDAAQSLHAPSHIASSVAGTSRTAGGGLESRRGGDSTFSSPAPSVRSLTTTLTTIQSLGPNAAVNAPTHGGHSSNQGNYQTIQFTQPFPTNSPASAIPPYLAPHSIPGHPTTYNSATANNLLTDNASILTLASSSKRRRRRSMDTDASVRALAPSSLWGGSRESLPLSVLSANIDGSGGRDMSTPGLHQSTSRIAGTNERTSIYSTTGITPTLSGERNSFYAKQSLAGDGASVRSGLLNHGRADSISGSVGGVNSPLTSPREAAEKGAVAEEKDENLVSMDKE